MFNKGIAQAEDRTLEMCMEHSSFESALRQNLPKMGDEGKLSQKKESFERPSVRRADRIKSKEIVS
jgi:hypothetical protein